MKKIVTASAKKSAAPMKVLIVDDEPFLAGIFKFALEQQGVAVIMAENGEVGVATAKDQKPDCILMDLQMPRLDGFEAISRLKADEATKDIPVIILSGLNQKEDIERGIALGAAGYLTKGQTLPKDAIAKMRQVCGSRFPEPPPPKAAK